MHFLVLFDGLLELILIFVYFGDIHVGVNISFVHTDYFGIALKKFISFLSLLKYYSQLFMEIKVGLNGYSFLTAFLGLFIFLQFEVCSS